MADTNARHEDYLPVVPYDTNREVVLRHADSVVVFDQTSRQLILRSREQDVDKPVKDRCSQCGRPYDHEGSAVEDFPDEQQPSYINNEYFRMLADSLPGTPSSRSSQTPGGSRAASRRRPLGQLRSPLSSAPVIAPPEDAEFVGSAPAPPDGTHGISESAFAPGYFERFFTVEKELGRGGRGVVLLVKHSLDRCFLGRFACKRVPVGDDHAWLEKVLVEAQALQGISHQNLVSYKHVWLEDYQINKFSPSVPCAFILQEYCNGGDLHTFVCAPAQVKSTASELKDRIRRKSRGESEMPRKHNEPRKLGFDQIYSFFTDITEGVRFLHLNGFIHRDLKPSNCLLHEVGGETRVLVSDFGEVQYENSVRKSTGATGTISYCAPEVLRPVSPGGPLGNFTFKSDIFSLGMILHFLCFATLPYYNANVLHEEAEDLDELRREILDWVGFDDRKRERPDLPRKLYKVLEQLLSIDPDKRPTADEVRQVVKSGNAGTAEFKPDLTRRSSGVGYEELSPGRRVVPIDSPATGSSSKPIKGKEAELIAPLANRRQNSTSLALNTNNNARSSQEMRSPELESAVMMRRTSSQGMASPTRQPATSPRFAERAPPPLSRPQSPRKELEPSPERKPQLLLPPPKPKRPLARAQELLSVQINAPSYYVLIFALKVWVLMQPCLASGINSNFFYSAFGFLMVELITIPHPVWLSILTTVIYTLGLWYAARNEYWCKPAWIVIE